MKQGKSREKVVENISVAQRSVYSVQILGWFGRPTQKAEEIAYCTFRAQKVFELQLEHPVEHDSVEV